MGIPSVGRSLMRLNASGRLVIAKRLQFIAASHSGPKYAKQVHTIPSWVLSSIPRQTIQSPMLPAPPAMLQTLLPDVGPNVAMTPTALKPRVLRVPGTA